MSWRTRVYPRGVVADQRRRQHLACPHGAADDRWHRRWNVAQDADVRPGPVQVFLRACRWTYRRFCSAFSRQKRLKRKTPKRQGVDGELIYGQGCSLVEVLQEFGDRHRASGVGNGQAHAFGTDVAKRFEAPQVCRQ